MRLPLPCSGESGDVRAFCARSLEELNVLRPVWERMQRHPNADIDFYATIVRSRPEIERPHVILIERQGNPCLLVVGRVERRPLRLCLGYKIFNGPQVRLLQVPYGGILGEGLREAGGIVLSHFVQMLGAGEIDLVNFSHLSVKCPIYSLVNTLSQRVCRRRATPTNPHYRLSLSGTYEQYSQRNRRSVQRNLRRYGQRVLQDWNGQIELRCYRMSAELGTVMRDAETIARKTYQRGIGVGFKCDEETRQRLMLQLERGWLRAYFLYLGGRPAAFSFITHYGDMAYAGETGYDPQFATYRVGHYLNEYVIERLCADTSITALDYGFGDAEYKRAICDQVWNELTISLFSPRRRGLALYALEGTFIAAGRLGQLVLHRSRLLPFVKRLWRRSVIAGRSAAVVCAGMPSEPPPLLGI